LRGIHENYGEAEGAVMIEYRKCWTGRRWININRGFFAIAFDPDWRLARIMFKKKYVYLRKANLG
jgi:hypothetical protein